MEHLVMETRLQSCLVLPVESQGLALRFQLRRGGGLIVQILKADS